MNIPPYVRSFLLFSIFLLIVMPLFQVLIIDSSDFHFKLRAVFLLQKVYRIAALSVLLFILLGYRKLNESTHINKLLLLLGVIFLLLNFYSQKDFNAILNEGISVQSDGIMQRIDYDGSRLFNIRIFNDMDNLAEIFPLQNRTLRKVLKVSSPEDKSLAFYTLPCDCPLTVKVNGIEYFLGRLNLLNDLPVEFKEGENMIEFNSSYPVKFFTQTIYNKGDTWFFDGRWMKNPWNDAIVYPAGKNTAFYTLMHKLGFIFRIAGILCLFFAFFGTKFSEELKKHKPELVYSTVFAYILYYIGFITREYWFVLSKAVALSLYYTLRIFFSDVTISISNPNLPFVGVKDFVLGIAEPCSGIDSIAFFISGYFLLTIVYWKDLDHKRHALLFLPGLFGAFALNIIRVFLIFLVGIFISRDFAVNSFHTNIALVLFTAYFIAYWMLITRSPGKKLPGKGKPDRS